MQKNLYRLIAFAAATQIVGCASIVSGSNQSISVETRSTAGPVIGATCKLTNNKGTWFVTTPGSATVHRSYEDLGVRCDKDSHDPAVSLVKSSTKGMAFGNILFGGFIGAGVDMSTGAAYDYPPLITVVMDKPAASVPGAKDAADKEPVVTISPTIPASQQADAGTVPAPLMPTASTNATTAR